MRIINVNSTKQTLTAAALALTAFAPTGALAFDEEMYSVSPVPRSEAHSLTLGINHTFLTKIVEDKKLADDLPEKNFGTRGANVAVTTQWIPTDMVALRALVGSRGGTVELGASGFYSIDYLAADVGANFIVHGVSGEKEVEFKKSFMPFVSFGSPFLFKEYNVDITLNTAYDSYTSIIGTGIGFGYNFGREHRIMAEYFPRITGVDTKIEEIEKKAAFGFGYRYHSFGHQYFLLLTNSPSISLRQSMLGSDNNNLGIAVRVNREM
jgi:hypothetical protein